MLKYAIKLKICSHDLNMLKYAFITFAWILLSSKTLPISTHLPIHLIYKNMLLHENPGSNN